MSSTQFSESYLIQLYSQDNDTHCISCLWKLCEVINTQSFHSLAQSHHQYDFFYPPYVSRLLYNHPHCLTMLYKITEKCFSDRIDIFVKWIKWFRHTKIMSPWNVLKRKFSYCIKSVKSTIHHYYISLSLPGVVSTIWSHVLCFMWRCCLVTLC